MRVYIPNAWGQCPAQSNHPINVRVLMGFPVGGALEWPKGRGETGLQEGV